MPQQQVMSIENENTDTTRYAIHAGTDTTARELLNPAIEWQQYIRGIS